MSLQGLGGLTAWLLLLWQRPLKMPHTCGFAGGLINNLPTASLLEFPPPVLASCLWFWGVLLTPLCQWEHYQSAPDGNLSTLKRTGALKPLNPLSDDTGTLQNQTVSASR